MVNDFGSAVIVTHGAQVLHGGDLHRCHPDVLSACCSRAIYSPQPAHDLFSFGAMVFEITHTALFSTVRQKRTPAAILAQWHVLILRVPFIAELLQLSNAVDYTGVLSLVGSLVLSDMSNVPISEFPISNVSVSTIAARVAAEPGAMHLARPPPPIHLVVVSPSLSQFNIRFLHLGKNSTKRMEIVNQVGKSRGAC